MKRDITFWLLLGAGALLLLGGGIVAYKITRGVRNNNPGNIEKGSAWKGLDPVKTKAESRFAVFVSPAWGFRALARVLKNYQSQYGLKTVREIIGRWSPDADPTNPAGSTSAYVAAVAKHLNVPPDSPITVIAKLPQLLDAIARHENSGYRFPASVIAEGIALERSA